MSLISSSDTDIPSPSDMYGRWLSLDRDALYIETQALTEEGKYHWALLHVDHSGTITRHHWAEPPPRSPRSIPADPQNGAERYTSEPVPSIPAAMRPGTTLLLGYCKLGQYLGGLTCVELEDVCKVAFRSGYASVSLNRAHGLSCQTWLFKVLSMLQERGCIADDISHPEIEALVCKVSSDADTQRLRAFLRRQPYETFVATV